MGTKNEEIDVRDIDVSKISKPAPVAAEQPIDVNVTGTSAVPVSTSGNSVAQQVNPGFEGLDSIASFMPYFVLDGTELLNKTDDSVHPSIEVTLTGGKPVWQLWDLSSNLVAESFDGNLSTDGRPMRELLAQEKEKSAEPAKINIQARYEIYFDWPYEGEGEKTTKLSLSPASKFAFADYTKELAKQGLKLDEVVTQITAERATSKAGFRYSKAKFEQVK